MQKIVTQRKKSYSIPIRFTWEEKFVLEEFSKEANLPLSTFIKSKLKPMMKTKLAKLNKTEILLEKIKSVNIPNKDIDLAATYGQEFRKNFKLTRG